MGSNQCNDNGTNLRILSIYAKCRNVCAHGERLFDFHTTDMIPDTLLHSKLGIPCKKGLYQNGKKTYSPL